jgi:uncharacterized protein (TIGR02391 family)
MSTTRGPLSADELRRLPTSECALRLLPSLAQSAPFCVNNVMRGAEQGFERNNERDGTQLLAALSDAWAWLVAHGLIGPDPTQISGEWMRLTKRGQGVAADPRVMVGYLAEDRLALNMHRSLEPKIRPVFALGNYETAAFAALKAVEVRVRQLAGVSDSAIGVPLMRSAFKKDGGALVDQDADGGEQVAIMELFAGAIGTFKNPASHRTVSYEDPTEAAEVVLLADLLMRLLDRVEKRRS